MSSTRESLIKLAGLSVTAIGAAAAEHLTGVKGLSELSIAGAGLLGALSHASFGHIGLEFVHGVAHRFSGPHPARNRENHDLHRLIGETIVHVLEHTKPGAPDAGWLARAAANFRGEPWMNIELDNAVSEPHLGALFSGVPITLKSTPVLDQAEWQDLIERVSPTRTREAQLARAAAAAALQAHFTATLWESAKHAWKSGDLAWPALILHLLSGIAGNAAQLPHLRAEIEALRQAVLDHSAAAVQTAPPADHALVEAIHHTSESLAQVLFKLDHLQTDVTAIRQSLENPKLAPTRERWISLPNTATEILARDAQADSLLAALRNPAPAIYSITALPGFGKTALLALALKKLFAAGPPPESNLAGIAVHDARLAPPGVAPFANLIGRITGLQDAAAHLAQAGPDPSPAVRALFFDLLAQAGPVWLVVDNAEAILAPAMQRESVPFRVLLSEWTAHRHAVRLLLLSRNALHPSPLGHHRLDKIEDVLAGGLPLADAVTVLRNNLAETRFRTAPDSLLRQVAEKLHRVPMALEQFAVHLRKNEQGIDLTTAFVEKSDLLRLDREEQLPRIIRENLNLLDSASLYLLQVVAWAATPVPVSGLLALDPDAAPLLTRLVQSHHLSVKEGLEAEGRSFDTHPLIRESLAGAEAPDLNPARLARAFTTAAGADWDQAQFRPALILYTLSDRAARLSGDRELQAGAADGHSVALAVLGRLEEAVSANDEAIAIYRSLVDTEGRRELRNDLAMAIMNRAVSLRNLGRLEEAVSAYDEAIALYRSLLDTEGRRELRNDLASAIMNRANSVQSLGRLEEAVSAYDEAIAIRRSLVDSEGRRELRNDLAMAIMNRAVSLQGLGRLEEAVSAYDEAIAIYRSLVDTEGRRELRNDLAMAIMNRAISLRRLGRLEEAVFACDEAIAIYRSLVDTEGRRELRNDLATAIMNRAVSLQSLGRLGEAVSAYDEAIAIRRSLVDTEDRRELRNDLASAIMNRANSLNGLGRLEEAVSAYDEAIAIYRSLVDTEGRRELRNDLAIALYNLTLVREQQNSLSTALAAARECRELWQACVADGMNHLRGDLDDAKALEAGLARAAATA